MPRQSERLSLKRRKKPENRGRKRRRQPNRRQFFEAKLRPAGKRERVDFLFGNKKHHLVPARAQHFRDRKAGKEMPAGSSTCNDGVHG